MSSHMQWIMQGAKANWTFTGVPSYYRFDRGYTGHEQLDRFGLINMPARRSLGEGGNGRVYDPVLGSFISPDPYMQAPDFTQNYNRYSYCFGNPLKYTDPSGYEAGDYFNTLKKNCVLDGSGNGGFLYRGGVYSWDPFNECFVNNNSQRNAGASGSYIIEKYWEVTFRYTDWYQQRVVYNSDGMPQSIGWVKTNTSFDGVSILFETMITPVFRPWFEKGDGGGSGGSVKEGEVSPNPSSSGLVSRIWNHPISRAIIPDALGIAVCFNSTSLFGGGFNWDYLWIIRGSDASLIPKVYLTPSLRTGEDMGPSVGFIYGSFLRTVDQLTVSTIEGPTADVNMSLVLGYNCTISLDPQKGTPLWNFHSITIGFSAGYSTGYGDSKLIFNVK